MFGFSEPDFEKDALKKQIDELENRVNYLECESLFRRGLNIIQVRLGISRYGARWGELLRMADANGYEYFDSVDCIFGTEVKFKKKEEKK